MSLSEILVFKRKRMREKCDKHVSFMFSSVFVNVSVNETEEVRAVTMLICMLVNIYLTNLNHAVCICAWLCF